MSQLAELWSSHMGSPEWCGLPLGGCLSPPSPLSHARHSSHIPKITYPTITPFSGVRAFLWPKGGAPLLARLAGAVTSAGAWVWGMEPSLPLLLQLSLHKGQER